MGEAREAREKMIRPRDHEVDIQRQFRVPGSGFDEGRTEGNVVHKMAVHHVAMDPVAAGGRHALDLGAELGKVAGQDRRGDENFAGVHVVFLIMDHADEHG